MGFVKRSYHEDYIDTIMPFFEYGDENYTVHYEDARSDGDQRYIGGGILIRRDKDDGFHYEGMIRTGHFDGDLHGTVSGNHIRYDTDSNYIAAHLGLERHTSAIRTNTTSMANCTGPAWAAIPS